jgi:hypothetical protein
VIERTANKVRSDLYPYAISANRPNGTWHNQVGYGLLDATSAVRAARPLRVVSDSIKFSSLIGRVEVTGVDVLLENVDSRYKKKRRSNHKSRKKYNFASKYQD